MLALRTADGAWVYPAFQLDEHNRVVAGLADVLDRFRPQTPDDAVMVAALLVFGLWPNPVLNAARTGSHAFLPPGVATIAAPVQAAR